MADVHLRNFATSAGEIKSPLITLIVADKYLWNSEMSRFCAENPIEQSSTLRGGVSLSRGRRFELG